jgi:hypothetical protein
MLILGRNAIHVTHSQKHKQVYVIFSVDTEHDIISRYETKAAGWSKGIPLLSEVFDASGIRGKVCWLIEYNLKDGILAANSHSEFFVKEFPELIMQIKNRGDELGLHPTMYDWLGGAKDILVSSYNDPELWDFTRSYHDPEFVINLTTSGVKEFREVCGVNPIGCRTGAFHYATHLAAALEKNGIHIDSSVRKKLKSTVTAPNAYYAARDNIQNKAPTKTGVVEIPTTGYVCKGWSSYLLKLRTWYLLHRRQSIFLSFYIHNWQAITTEGRPDTRFLESLSSFLRLLSNHGVRFLNWTEACEMYENIFGTGNGASR